MGRKYCGLPAFSPFPTMFSKAFFLLGRSATGLCNKELSAILSEHGSDVLSIVGITFIENVQ